MRLCRRLSQIALLFAFILGSRHHSGQAQVGQGTFERQRDGATGGTAAVHTLLQFKNSIENWNEFAAANRISGWTVDSPVCAWTGIICSEREAEILTLSLPCSSACQVRAQGRIFVDVFRLSHLESLNLEGQAFRGPLPTQWFQTDAWPTLQSLFLSGNPLGGVLPDSQTGSLRALMQLRVTGCELAGSLPATWGRDAVSMSRMSVLRAANNNLNGSLPVDWGTAAAFARLETLDLTNNSLAGPLPHMWQLPDAGTYLKELYLGSNQFTGGLPPGYGGPKALKSLRYLTLSRNPLGGSIPQEWGLPNAWPHLRVLDLADIQASGPLLPSMLTAFPELEVLHLAYNNLSGPIPASYANFTQLNLFFIVPGNERLCGPLPPNLPFKLCDDQDPACLRTPDLLLPDCPAGVEPPYVPPPLAGAISANATGKGGGGASTGAIVGGAVGGVIILAMVVMAVLLLRRLARQQAKELPRSTSLPSQLPFVAEGEEGLPWGVRGLELNGIKVKANPVAAHPAAEGDFAASFPPSRSTTLLTAATQPSLTPLGSLLTALRSLPEGTVASGEPFAAHTSMFGQHGGGERALLAVENGDVAHAASAREVDLDVPLSDWEINLNELDVMHRPDGSEWKLGSGGFGKVYKAIRLGVQPVAVKLIPSPPVTHPAERLQVQREIAILRACRDANIVQFQGAYMGPDFTVLVTEYMDGGDLMSNIAAGRVSWWKRGRKIAVDIAKGLAFLHARRIVHFDLKSPNILLARDGSAKIADVGMARFMAHDYVTGVVATLAWSAPEMLWGAKCTAKADIYSFGIILWEICSGEQPVRGQLRDLRVPEECPAEMRDLMLECLDTQPINRPSAVQIVERLVALPRVQGPAAAASPPHYCDPSVHAGEEEVQGTARQQFQ